MVCCRCEKRVESILFSDHRGGICPHCGTTCVFLRWDRWTQIVPADAPHAVKAFIEWSQRELDELDFMDLMVFLDDVLAQPPSSQALSRSDPIPPSLEEGRSK